MINTLIFDLDGTLADTIDAIMSGMNLTMKTLGHPVKTREEIRAAINHGARALVRNCLPESERGDEERVSEALAVYQGHYATTFRETDRLYDGVEEVLRALAERGYTIAVFSNKQDEFVTELVANLVPAGICKIARGQRPGVKAKPDREVSLALCEELGAVPSECALIGDSHVDIQTAKNAGFLAVGVSWGYRPEVLRTEGADHIVDNPEELLSLFPPLR